MQAGVAIFLGGWPAKAVEVAMRAESLGGSFAAAALLGTARLALARERGAQVSEEALESLERGASGAEEALAVAKARAGRRREAFQRAIRAVRATNGTAGHGWHLLALLRLGRGQRRKGREAAEAGLELPGTGSETRARLFLAKAMCSESDEAHLRALGAAASEGRGTPAGEAALARAAGEYRRLGRREDARKAEEALRGGLQWPEREVALEGTVASVARGHEHELLPYSVAGRAQAG